MTSFTKFFTIGFILLFVSPVIYIYVNARATDSSKNDIRTYEHAIKPDEKNSFYRLTKSLYDKQIIRSQLLFKLISRLENVDKKLQEGYYRFNTSMSLFDVLHKLQNAQSEQIAITILDTYDLYEIDYYFKKYTNILQQKDNFWQQIHQPKWLNYIKEKTRLSSIESLEGFIYPDTYYLPKGAHIDLFIELAIDHFVEKIFHPYSNYSPQELYQYMIIASLIQKETTFNEEKPLISSVLYNRLNINEKLRFDPTVIYAMKKTGRYKHGRDAILNIRTRDLLLPSKYNTYYMKGLPPTPICSPTFLSLEAAINPTKTDYFFFVARRDKKGHLFSKTYDQHKKYIKQVLNK